jgi:hypothetical protein
MVAGKEEPTMLGRPLRNVHFEVVCEKDGRVLGEGEEGGGLLRYPNFLLYWYKSTHTGVRKGRASAG